MKENKAMVNEKFGRLSGDVLLFTLVCLVAALASGNASAATRYRVLGTIENVDSAGNTITVRLSDGTDKTLQLAKHVMVNGREETRSRARSH